MFFNNQGNQYSFSIEKRVRRVQNKDRNCNNSHKFPPLRKSSNLKKESGKKISQKQSAYVELLCTNPEVFFEMVIIFLCAAARFWWWLVKRRKCPIFSYEIVQFAGGEHYYTGEVVQMGVRELQGAGEAFTWKNTVGPISLL